eukprot:SAG11_NODE_697_length_7684_cov_8.250231_10_plen_185_part_00
MSAPCSARARLALTVRAPPIGRLLHSPPPRAGRCARLYGASAQAREVLRRALHRRRGRAGDGGWAASLLEQRGHGAPVLPRGDGQVAGQPHLHAEERCLPRVLRHGQGGAKRRGGLDVRTLPPLDQPRVRRPATDGGGALAGRDGGVGGGGGAGGGRGGGGGGGAGRAGAPPRTPRPLALRPPS